MKIKISALVVAAFAFCFANVASADTRYVGVFTPLQSALTDRIVGDDDANDYFMRIWTSYEIGNIDAATGHVQVFLETNGRQVTIFEGVVLGHQYFGIDRSQVSRDTMLCVRPSWPFMPYQRRANEQGVNCTPPGQVNRWFTQGRGRRPGDAWGVMAFYPAGI